MVISIPFISSLCCVRAKKLRCRPKSVIAGDADVDHSKIMGGCSQIIEGIYPPSPRVSAPLNENNLRTRRRGSIVCERLLWTAPYEIMYCYKFSWKKTSLQNEFMQRTGWSSVFTFQDRQKSKEHNTIQLTFMICSVKQLSAVSVNCQSFAIIQ